MVKIKHIENTTSELNIILSKTIKALEEVLASELFKKRFMASDWDVMINKEKTDKVSNEGVYLLTQGDLEIDLLRFYYSDSMIGGTAYEPEGRIKINTKHFREETTATNADTLFHEYLHLLGFDHDSSQDLDSVPYQSGNIIERILREYPYKGGKLKRVSKGFPLCFLKEWRWV